MFEKRSMKTVILLGAALIFSLILPAGAAAQGKAGSASAFSRQGALSAEEIEPLRALKESVRDVDTKSFQETIGEIQESDYPRLTLKIRAAMIQAYADIVRETPGEMDIKQKRWLYNRIALNMAYLQFGAGIHDASAGSVDSLIRRKLSEHLPQDVFRHPAFRISLE